MRKILLFLYASILLALLSNSALAQPFASTAHTGWIYQRLFWYGSGAIDLQNSSKDDSTAYAWYSASLQVGKKGDNKGTILNRPANHLLIPAPQMGMWAFDTTTKHAYVYDGLTWTMLDSAGGGSGTFDTTAIYAAIADRVKYSDTGTMLAPYLRKIDTTGKWIAAGNVFIRPSDTAAMLSPYLRKIDTTNKWLPVGTTFVGSEVDPLSPHLSDSTVKYVTPTQLAAFNYLTSYTETDPLSAHAADSGTVWVTKSQLDDTANAIRNDFPSVSGFITQSDLDDSTAAIRADFPDITGLATQQALEDTADAIRNDFPSVAGFATQQGLDDTAAAIRAAIPSITGYVPYTGATTTVDLGANRLVTTDRVEAATLRLTNPTSHGDWTSAATVPRSYVAPDWSGQALVVLGNGTSGQVIQSNGSSAPTWVTPSSGGLWTTSSVTGTTNAGSTNFGSITPSSGQMVVIRVTYSGIVSSSGGGGIAYGLFYNNAGTIETFNTGDIVFFNGSPLLAGAVMSMFNISGTTISYNIDTAPPAGTVNWKVEFEYKIY